MLQKPLPAPYDPAIHNTTTTSLDTPIGRILLFIYLTFGNSEKRIVVLPQNMDYSST